MFREAAHCQLLSLLDLPQANRRSILVPSEYRSLLFLTFGNHHAHNHPLTVTIILHGISFSLARRFTRSPIPLPSNMPLCLPHLRFDCVVCEGGLSVHRCQHRARTRGQASLVQHVTVGGTTQMRDVHVASQGDALQRQAHCRPSRADLVVARYWRSVVVISSRCSTTSEQR